MVEELKLAIKIDNDAIEQSLLKEFAEAEKMADKVVLTFKNVNLDNKNIEAEFKEMQKIAGKNPIDLSINDDKAVAMLSAISEKIKDIFEKANGKSLLGNSGILSDEKSLEKIIDLFSKMEAHLEKIRNAFGEAGDGSTFSPLLKTIDDVQSSIKELSTSVSDIKLNVNMDLGAENRERIGQSFSQLEKVVERLNEISSGISGIGETFGNVFDEKLKFSVSTDEIEKLTNKVKELEDELAKIKDNSITESNKSNISSMNSTIEDVFRGKDSFDSNSRFDSRDTADYSQSVIDDFNQIVSVIQLTDKELEEFTTHYKLLKQTGRVGDEMLSAKVQKNNGQTEDWYLKKNEQGTYDIVKKILSTDYKGFEKTIISAENKLRDLEATKNETLSINPKANTSNIDREIEYQKEYVNLLDKTAQYLRQSNETLLQGAQIEKARNQAAQEYYLRQGTKQNIDDAKKSASTEQKRLKNIEQVNRALNKQQILIDSIEKTYSREKNGDLDEAVDNEDDLKELAEKKNEITNLINNLSGQERNSSNEAEFLELEKLIAEYKELAMYKLKANNSTEQKLGGKKLEVAIEEQIAQYDKLIVKAEKYGDETSGIVDALKKQREILGRLDNNGKHTATSDDYINARNEYRIANSQVSSIETKAKVDAEKAKEVQKAWDDGLKTIKEYMDAQTELNNLNAADKGTGKKSKAIEEQARKVEELREKAVEAKVNLASMTDFQNIDMSTWKQWLEVMRNFAEATTGSKESIAKLEDSIKNVNNSSLDSIGTDIKKYQNKIDTINYGRKDEEKSSEFEKFVADYQEAIDALDAKKKELEEKYKDSSVGIIPKKELDAVEELEAALKKIDINYQTIFKGSTEISRDKELDTITKYMEKNTRISQKAKKELQGFIDVLKNNGADANVGEIHSAFLKVCDVERKAKREGESFLDVIKEKVWYQWAAQIGGYFGLNDIINYGKQAVKIIIELDTALVDLNKTTVMSSSQMKEFYFDANDVAKEMGTTTAAIIEQASAWSRLGYNTKEAATEMAKLSSKFATISPGMDTDTAQEGLVAIMKAWDISYEDVESEILDKINILGNNFAEENQDIVEGMERSAAALAAVGTSYTDAFAIFTGAQEVLQNAEKTGTAIRSVALRLRSFDEETEEVSEDLANITGELADLTKTAEHSQGVSIFKEGSTTEFKSLVDYFGEINDIWDEMSQKQQNDYLIKAFGRTQAQAGAALIQNYDAVKDSIAMMKKSAGSAESEMAAVESSIEYKINTLSQTWVGTIQKLIDRGDIGTIVDGLTKISEVIGFVVNKAGILGTISLGAGLFAGINNVG